jgi:hypothetical protein
MPPCRFGFYPVVLLANSAVAPLALTFRAHFLAHSRWLISLDKALGGRPAGRRGWRHIAQPA